MEEISDKQRRKVIREIDRYLTERENDGDGEAQVLCLLSAAKEALEEKGGEKEGRRDTEAIQTTLKEIQHRLTRIEEQGPHTQKARKNIYAGAAQSGAILTRTRTADEQHTKKEKEPNKTMESSRKAREITIKIRDPKDQQHLSDKPNKEVTEALRRTAPTVIGINRLASGDVRVTTNTPAERRKLQDDTTWMKVLGESAAVSRRTYRVMVPGVRMRAVDTSQQEEAIQHLQTINAGLHQELKITRVGWSTRATREGKTFSSLSVDVETPAMANKLINQGILIDFELKYCEKYTPPPMSTNRCHNCQNYGHFHKVCKKAPICGHCAGNHVSYDCDGKEKAERHQCAVCGERGHTVWADSCRLKQQAQQRALKAKALRARVYPALESSPIMIEPTIECDPHTPRKRAASQTGPTTPTSERGRHASIEKENRTRSQSYFGMMDRGMREKAFAKKKVGRPKILALSMTELTNVAHSRDMDTTC